MKSTQRNVTLEDLLRVKRAEQPSPEFWAQFELGMRSKQLAAIVEPRPWWAPMIKFGARLSHYQLPVGAAAILLVSFVTIREYRSPSLSSIYTPHVAVQSAMPVEESERGSQVSLSSRVSTGVVPVSSESEVESVESVASPSAVADPVVEAATVATSPGTMFTVEREPSPSERYIAANLAAAQAADPSLMDDVFNPALRHAQSRQPVRDPLAQVNAPGESRRSRLLATALPVMAGNSDLGVGTSDRVARHLTEERLYDTITRVGVKGDRVAIKF